MKTLTKKLKQKWIDALKSGKYAQANGILHNKVAESYCCLGVLDAIEPGVKTGSTYLLTLDTGLASESCVKGLEKKVQIDLAEMNDDGQSFDKIADWIDKNINPKR